jgi:hypothetical protein
MICNVLDHRKRQHRWKRVKAIIEPTWHDNSVADADQAEAAATESDYDEQSAISVEAAVAWAHALPYAVTLYLYDED